MKRLLCGLLAACAVGMSFAASVSAETSTVAGPTVTVDRTNSAPGEEVSITVTGFEAGWLTVSVCGNAAALGSADCNMMESVAVEIPDSTTPVVRPLVVAKPPKPCPCVLRVADRTNSVVILADLSIDGQPVAAVVGGGAASAPLDVTVDAVPTSSSASSWLRSRLGGASEYRVTVSIRNASAVELRDIRLSGSAGRSASADLLQLGFDDPGTIGPGQSWEQTVTAFAPAPSFDDIEWRVFVSGAGDPVAASKVTHQRPTLLAILVVLFFAILSVLLMRWRMRRHIDAAFAVQSAVVR